VKTDRTAPYNKKDSIIRDNEKGTCLLQDTDISGHGILSELKLKRFKKKERPDNRSTAGVEGKNKSDTSNKWGNWNHLKIIQKILEPHTAKQDIK
jgi:hypothetical protein